MNICTICPRKCTVNPEKHQYGVCGRGRGLFLARAALHFWEEPCISGEKGSGAVFFCGCNLHCKFCQNYEIACGKGQVGKEVSIERLSEIFLELQEKGANNINLVTPDHRITAIIPALERAKKEGLRLPIVYNSSSYVNLSALQSLDGLIDIYLPDFKYMSSELAARCAQAPDYPQVAKAAIAEMVRQTGSAEFFDCPPSADPIDEGCLMKRGTIVRHLLLPGHIEDSKQIIHYLYETYGNRIYQSIMNQYTPLREIEGLPELSRKVSEEEYEEVLSYAIDLGLEQGFFQDGDVAEDSFIPAFTCEGV